MRTVKSIAPLVLAACAGGCNQSYLPQMNAGEYAKVRHELVTTITTEKGDRNFALDRMRLTIAALGDGYPQAAEKPAKELYEILTTAGVNKDRTVLSAVTVENVRIWKGEPFEQAMGYCYTAIQRASSGQWDNARVAAKESLFMLKNFAESEEKKDSLTTLEIAKKAQEADIAAAKARNAGAPNDQAANAETTGAETDSYFDKGYQPIETDFVLGYMLAGITSLANPSGSAEASDNFAKALKYNPGLESVVKTISSKQFNTIFVVDAGNGPVKVRYGMDGVFTKFDPRTPSDMSGLTAELSTGASTVAAPAVDLNGLAVKHFWNNMEDVRVAKSYIGTALLAAGAVTAGTANRNDNGQAIAGFIMMFVGLFMKASAAADIRHCEFLPQRVYVVPVTIAATDTRITFSIPSQPQWTLSLPAIDPPPAGQPFQLRYVRLANPTIAEGSPSTSPAWALPTAQIVYANDEYAGEVPGDTLPYILGGTCVKRPTAQVLKHYQSAGNLLDMSLTDLESMYAEEGIFWDSVEPRALAELHVLDGGKSLLPPQAGTVGYPRLFCSPHGGYTPQGATVKRLQAEYKAKVAAVK